MGEDLRKEIEQLKARIVYILQKENVKAKR